MLVDPFENVVFTDYNKFTNSIDFNKLDIRTGIIKSAESVNGDFEFVKLTVDLGSEERVIVSKLENQYLPQTLTRYPTNSVLVVRNVPPTKIEGEESHGLLLYLRYKGVIKLMTSRELEGGIGISLI